MLKRLAPDDTEIRLAMTTELAPCPWCGHTPVMWTEQNETSGLFVSRVACGECFVAMHCCMPTRGQAQAGVTSRWAKRI